MFFALFLYEILICEESLMLPSNFSEDSFCAGFSAERVGDSLGGTCPLRIFIMILRRKKYYYVSKVPVDRVEPLVKLYPSIDQALSSFIGQNLGGMWMYVYEVAPKPESLIKDPRIEEEPFREILGTSHYLAPLTLKNPKKIKVEKVKEVKKITNGWRGLKTPINVYQWKEEYPKTKIPKLFHVMDKGGVDCGYPSLTAALSETPGLVGKEVVIGMISEQPEICCTDSLTGKVTFKRPIKLKEYKKVSPTSMKRLGKIYLYEI